MKRQDDEWTQLQARYPWPKKKPDVPTNVHGWKTWGPYILQRIKKLKTPIIVEVGTWTGKNILELRQARRSLRAICIDHWKGGPEHQEGQPHWQPFVPYLFDQFVVNLWSHRRHLVPMRMDSADGLFAVYESSVEPDLIYIDGCHLYDKAREDIWQACTLFPHAVVCGDDYDKPRPNGVKKAVDEVRRELNCDLYQLGRFWCYENR